MTKRMVLAAILLLAGAAPGSAQQVADLEYNPALPRPAYEPGKGPRVAIDEAHHDFHTIAGRYRPFAALLRRDGYRMEGFRGPFTANALLRVDVLVIANALNERNAEEWSLPTPSAFSKEEIAAVRAWVEKGGALLLIADHMPFAGAAAELAGAFGVEFCNGFAAAGHWEQGKPESFERGRGLRESAITRGRAEDEAVTSVTTFTGSAFKAPVEATPVLEFGPNSTALTPDTAWVFTPATPRAPIEGWCQGAVLEIGKGRVAVFGEAAMFSAQLAGPQKRPMGMNAPSAPQDHQLLLNVMHWLSRAKGMPD